MLKLSKKVEYAILAMQFMALNPHELYTAKQIAEENDLSYEFLAKSLQCLNKKGLINSQQGTRGGYTLARSSIEITISDIIDALEQKTAIVDCTKSTIVDKEDCSRVDFCNLKDPMQQIQEKINSIFENTTLWELTVGIKSDKAKTNGVVTV